VQAKARVLEQLAVLVCYDLNDTMDAATTQLMFRPPGSQISTGGFNHPDHSDAQRPVGQTLDERETLCVC
jgi:hypothetical protein